MWEDDWFDNDFDDEDDEGECDDWWKEVDNAFNFIPDDSNKSVIYTKDTTPVSIGVKPVKITEEKAE